MQRPDSGSHYETLNVSRTASQDDIRIAYRRLASKFHPDKCPGDVAAATLMVGINQAYEVLSTPKSRQVHDNWLAERQRQHQLASPDIIRPVNDRAMREYEDVRGYTGDKVLRPTPATTPFNPFGKSFHVVEDSRPGQPDAVAGATASGNKDNKKSMGSTDQTRGTIMPGDHERMLRQREWARALMSFGALVVIGLLMVSIG